MIISFITPIWDDFMRWSEMGDEGGKKNLLKERGCGPGARVGKKRRMRGRKVGEGGKKEGG